jgi:DNA-binding NarL/FixJ family response regulator
VIHIIIVDGHNLIREGIKRIIDQSNDMLVIGEADSVTDASRLIKLHRPDVVVLDINLPDESELDALVKLRSHSPNLPLLVLSMYTEERFGVAAIKAGADGYLTKSATIEEVKKAICCVSNGHGYASPSLAKLLAMEVRSCSPGSCKDILTNREQEVTTLLCKGKKTKQIAAELSISISSVNTYRKRIFDKLKLASDVALMHYAFKNGLVE